MDGEAEAAVEFGAESAGAQLAERIAAEIAASGAPPGAVVASETALRAQHEAGRTVFRQAVRILEARGIAYMRRGYGGGLVVAEASAEFAARGLSILAESVSESLTDLAALQGALESYIFIHSAPHLSPQKCAELRRLGRKLDALPEDQFLKVAAHRQLHRAIQTITGEPAIELTHRAVTEYGIDLIPYSVNVAVEGSKGEPWRNTLATAEALAAGDVRGALQCRERLAEIFGAQMSSWGALERDPSEAPRVGDSTRPEFEQESNQAERLTREILREIRLLRWRSGARIGGLAELMDRYGASTNILRQAIRVLQEHSAVQVVRGRKGGLFVATPDRARAIGQAVSFLAQSRADPADARAFLLQLALQAVDRWPNVTPARLAAWFAGDEVNVADLLANVVFAAPNATLAIFGETLLPLAREGAPRAPSSLARDLVKGDRADRRRGLQALTYGILP